MKFLIQWITWTGGECLVHRHFMWIDFTYSNYCNCV